MAMRPPSSRQSAPGAHSSPRPRRGAIEGLLAEAHDCVILVHPETHSHQTVLDFASFDEAAAFLRRTFSRGDLFLHLRRALDDWRFHGAIVDRTDDQVVEQLAELLVRGRIRIARRSEVEMVGGRWAPRKTVVDPGEVPSEFVDPEEPVDISFAVTVEDPPSLAGDLQAEDPAALGADLETETLELGHDLDVSGAVAPPEEDDEP